jgi:hypothetical protein
MFSVKIFNGSSGKIKEAGRTIETVLGHIRESLNRRVKVISDDFCVEMVSGKDAGGDTLIENGSFVTELLIKKTIFINIDDLSNRDKLDRYLSEVKNFCEQADKIEGIEYMPINFRTLK